MPVVGEIWRHARFYPDPDTGELLPKFLLVLAVRGDEDVVYRLLTSRAHGRPMIPPCNHNPPYPSFFLGVITPGGQLPLDTWLDLREIEDDYDAREFADDVDVGVLTFVERLPLPVLCAALACAAYAPDTLKRQKNSIMDAKQALGCPG